MRTGECLDEFRIKRLLGQGGMGAVYEAYQPSLQRLVALKVLPDWLAADKEAYARFQYEAATAARLDHPNIVPIYAFGCSGGHPYFAMKVVRGLSLWDLIQHERCRQMVAQDPTLSEPLALRETSNVGLPASDQPTRRFTPLDDAAFQLQGEPDPHEQYGELLVRYRRQRYALVCDVGQQCAKALAHAHGQGELHRDIKPSNIMLDKQGHVYVIDFGLARAVHSHTASQHICGTLRFMSPEQLALGKLDGRTDIYSLGVTLYELAACRPAFDAQDTEAVAAKIRAGDFQPILEICPDMPPALAQCIERAMQARPDDRFATADELAAALDRAATALAEPPALPASPAPRLARRGWWRAVGVALLLALLLCGGGYLASSVWGPSDDVPPVFALSEDPLQLPPRVVLGSPTSLRDYAPVLRQFTALGPLHRGEPTLFSLGRPKKLPVTVEVTFQDLVFNKPHTNWFHMGVFVGWKAKSHGAEEQVQFQTIYLEREGLRRKKWYCVRMLKHGVRDGREERLRCRGLPDLASTAGELPENGCRVKFTLTQDGIINFTVNGSELRFISSDDANRRFRPEDYEGELGICVREGSLVVRDIKVTYHQGD